MKMTREESIRNFREHWASLAITGTDDKKEYLSRHGFPYISCDCFLCEYATNGMEKDCNKCPIEWPETRTDMEYDACIRSFYGDWEGAESPEERKRLAAIIRDLPEKQEVKLKPKFSVGDKVYPVSKTVPGFEDDIKEDVHWQKSEPRGYFFVTDIDEYKTKSTGKTVYVCNFRKNTTTGNYFFESDLRPYVEPEKDEEPRFQRGDKVVPIGISWADWTLERYFNCQSPIPKFLRKNGYLYVAEYRDGQYYCGSDNLQGRDRFYPSELIPYVEPEKKREPAFKVGDKVKVVKETHDWGEVKPGDIGVITKVLDGLYFADFPAQKSWHGKEECFELVTSINRCPEDKAVTVQTITIEFKGPKTICTIENQFGTFKGRAKCHPTVHWNEKTGADLALKRAVEKFNEYQPDA